MTGLIEEYGAILHDVHTRGGAALGLFRPRLSHPPDKLRIDDSNFSIQRVGRNPNARLIVRASKEALGCLGLIVIAHISHCDTRVEPTELVVEHSGSAVRLLRISITHDTMSRGPLMKPVGYRYFPVRLHSLRPLADSGERSHVPYIGLERSIGEGFGDLEQSAVLANLLLDLSHPENDRLQVELQGENAVRHRIDLSWVLPGAIGFDLAVA